MDKLEESHYFITPIYAIKKPEFLDFVRGTSDRYLAAVDEKKMTQMTGNFSHEPEISDFAQYVSQTVWNILNSQGYKMDNLVTYFTEMWTQEHNFQSNMEIHMHGHGAVMSAFYFLDTPLEGCKMVIEDPRPAKTITNLWPADDTKVTQASQQIILNPQAGTLVFTPAWLPHGFTRNLTQEPSRFVHMNLAVTLDPKPKIETEVV